LGSKSGPTGTSSIEPKLNLWRDIIDSLTDAIVVLSPAMDPQVANPAAETMLGVSPVTAQTVADLVRQNDWLSRMVTSCLSSGQDLAIPRRSWLLARGNSRFAPRSRRC